MSQRDAKLVIRFANEADYRAGKPSSAHVEISEFELAGDWRRGNGYKQGEKITEYTLPPDDPICRDERWDTWLDPEEVAADTGYWVTEFHISDEDVIREWLLPELERRPMASR